MTAILITGPRASGKTVTAKVLTAASNWETTVIDLSGNAAVARVELRSQVNRLERWAPIILDDVQPNLLAEAIALANLRDAMTVITTVHPVPAEPAVDVRINMIGRTDTGARCHIAAERSITG